jgi:hypothetical protein
MSTMDRRNASPDLQVTVGCIASENVAEMVAVARMSTEEVRVLINWN